jgi:hypothetical protein
MAAKRNYYFLLTNLFFAAMAIFAVIFAQERFQADGAYYLFKIVNYGDFQIEHQRFILAVSQVLPLIGAKLGLTMNSIIVLNSLNNVVFFYLVFLYAVYFLKDKTAGVAIILFQCFGVLNIQFTPMYEIWYGTILIVLVKSHIFLGRYNSVKDVFLLGVITITVLFSHPLMFIPVIFIILFEAMEKWFIQWRLLCLMVFVFAVWYIIKKMFLSTYEAGKISMLDLSTNKAYLDLTHPSYYWKLIKFFFTWYTIPVFVYLITVGFYYVRKAKRKIFLLSAFFFGQILLVNLTHVMDWSLTPYFERMYMPIIPIIFLPFLYDMFTQLGLRNNVGAILLCLIIVWRIGRFVDVGLDYKKQTRLSEQLIDEAQKCQGSKFEMDGDDEKGCLNWADWSYTMESMIRSSAKDPNHVVTIATWFDFYESNNRAQLNENDFMMRRWELMPDYAMNQKYFHISHGKYVQLKPICGKQ